MLAAPLYPMLSLGARSLALWMIVMMMIMMKQGASLSRLGDVGSVALWMADQNRSNDAIEKN